MHAFNSGLNTKKELYNEYMDLWKILSKNPFTLQGVCFFSFLGDIFHFPKHALNPIRLVSVPPRDPTNPPYPSFLPSTHPLTFFIFYVLVIFNTSYPFSSFSIYILLIFYTCSFFLPFCSFFLVLVFFFNSIIFEFHSFAFFFRSLIL